MTDYYSGIQKAIDFIETQLTQTLSLQLIAERACFSPYHFHRLFGAVTGTTVKEYIRKRRLSEAARENFCSLRI